MRCPALIVRGEHGELSAADAVRMRDSIATAELCTIPGAGHDVHLDRPDALRDVVYAFIARRDS